MSNGKGAALVLLAGAAAGGFYLWSARREQEQRQIIAARSRSSVDTGTHWALQGQGGNSGGRVGFDFAPLLNWGIGEVMNSTNRNNGGGFLSRIFGGNGGGNAGKAPAPAQGAPVGGGSPRSGGGGWPDGLPASLVRTESSGDWTASNNVPGSGGNGHFGRGQFSIGRLKDAKRAGVIPQSMTPQQFMSDPNAQIAVERWHVRDIQRFIERNGLDQYLGQTIGGVTVTENGMIGVAHLGGVNGLRRFLTSGGSHNPSDAYGTSLADYLRIHGGQ